MEIIELYHGNNGKNYNGSLWKLSTFNIFSMGNDYLYIGTLWQQSVSPRDVQGGGSRRGICNLSPPPNLDATLSITSMDKHITAFTIKPYGK